MLAIRSIARRRFFTLERVRFCSTLLTGGSSGSAAASGGDKPESIRNTGWITEKLHREMLEMQKQIAEAEAKIAKAEAEAKIVKAEAEAKIVKAEAEAEAKIAKAEAETKIAKAEAEAKTTGVTKLSSDFFNALKTAQIEDQKLSIPEELSFPVGGTNIGANSVFVRDVYNDFINIYKECRELKMDGIIFIGPPGIGKV